MFRTVARCFLAALLCASALIAHADFPDRPIRIVVPYAAGGPTDIHARIIARLLSEQLGGPVLVDNRPGANGVVGTSVVAKATADGYTLSYNVVSLLSKVYLKDPPFDLLKDFEPIGAVYRGPQMLVVSSQVPATTVAELIAHAKANPGKLNYSTGTAVTTLSMERLKATAGINIVQIPYKGAGPAVAALGANEVQVTVSSLTAFAPLVQAGKARILAVLGDKRMAAVPNVPTIHEAGFNINSQFTFGVFGPAGIPKPVLDKLRDAMTKVAANPQMQQAVRDAGTPLLVPPDQLWKIVGEEIAAAAAAAKLANYVPE
ncbi:MAG TPA: tripartite tricarboxylate transporter substrate binding protein [Ramlibacter sp.]|nr:tripartite tricarboxylate transporter substrate binding protein [Ramlibacter sp.]